MKSLTLRSILSLSKSSLLRSRSGRSHASSGAWSLLDVFPSGCETEYAKRDCRRHKAKKDVEIRQLGMSRAHGSITCNQVVLFTIGERSSSVFPLSLTGRCWRLERTVWSAIKSSRIMSPFVFFTFSRSSEPGIITQKLLISLASLQPVCDVGLPFPIPETRVCHTILIDKDVFILLSVETLLSPKKFLYTNTVGKL